MGLGKTNNGKKASNVMVNIGAYCGMGIGGGIIKFHMRKAFFNNPILISSTNFSASLMRGTSYLIIVLGL